LRRRLPWLLAIALGLVSIGLLVRTYQHVHHELATAETKIEEAEHTYRELRAAGKTNEADQALIDEIRRAAKEDATRDTKGENMMLMTPKF